MGFIVTGSVIDGAGNTHDNFYVRIDHYQIQKSMGNICTTIGQYTSKEGAAKAFPEHQEDYLKSDASAYISTPWTTGSHKWGGVPIEYPLTQSVITPEIYYYNEFEDKVVEYIDYDDDGNEITAQRTESVEVVRTASVEVTKSLIDLDQITGSVYQHAYARVKNTYSEIYGSNNIQDLD